MEWKDFSGHPSYGLQNKLLPIPCADCRTLDCYSLHGPVKQECLLKTCYVCADLARIDEEITSTQKRLKDLVEERKRIMAKPNHETMIYCVPVEILSSIFLFLKDTVIDVNHRGTLNPFDFQRPEIQQQPFQSPPLLVGAVCKRWRDVTLKTPHLWTDIIINLDKPPHGQFKMIKEWAKRSSGLPLDISISQDTMEADGDSGIEFSEVVFMLRMLAARWNDISLNIKSAYFFYGLFNDPPETPHLRTLFSNQPSYNYPQFKNQHPLRPKHLILSFNSIQVMPFGWDRLVFVDMGLTYDEGILHVIRHARRLQHCIGMGTNDGLSQTRTFQNFILNRSLIYLKTTCNVLDHITLPSLLHLDCQVSENPDHHIESISLFLERSCPPLPDFTLRYWSDQDPIPRFETLPGITSLLIMNYELSQPQSPARLENFLEALTQPSANPILPRLNTLWFRLHHLELLAPAWSMLSDLFPVVAQTTSPTDVEAIPNTSIAPRRPLSMLNISLLNNKDHVLPKIYKDTLLRLLQVKQSGVDVVLIDDSLGDLFEYMAEVYGIEQMQSDIQYA